MKYKFYGIEILDNESIRFKFINSDSPSLGDQFISINVEYEKYKNITIDELKKYYFNLGTIQNEK